MVRKLIIVILLMLMAFTARASNYVSIASGYFDNPLCWTNVATGANGWPNLSNDMWTINHTISYTNYSGNVSSGDSIIYTNCILNGTLDMTQACRIAFGGSQAMTGTGLWTIGRSSLPIGYDTLGYNGTGAVVTVALYGTTSYFQMKRHSGIAFYGTIQSNVLSYLSQSAGIGTNVIHLTSSLSARTNDVICVSKQVASVGATYHKISAITNNDIYYSADSANNFGYYSEFATNYFSSTNITSLRQAYTSGVILVSGNPILFTRGTNVSSVVGFISFTSPTQYTNYVMQGVRFHSFDRVVTDSLIDVTKPSYHQFIGCTFDNCSLANQPCFSVGGCMFSNCVWSLQNQSAQIVYGSGCKLMNCVGVNTIYGLIGVGNDNLLYGCNTFNNYAGLIDAGTRITAIACTNYYSATALAYAFNGDNYLFDCTTVGDRLYHNLTGYGNYACGCTSINAPDYIIDDGLNVGSFIVENLIVQGARKPYFPWTYYAGEILVSQIVITESNSATFMDYNGACTSQVAVVSPATSGLTMCHTKILNSTKEIGWSQQGIARPFGSARWTVYMRRENTNVTQYAVISTANRGLNRYAYPHSVLATVQNTNPTGTWLTCDLVWNNTNNYAVPVQLQINAFGIIGTNGYSSALKSDESILRSLQ